jgi:hypothetical protein
MIDFRSLDRETRSIALVGRFLELWASMEWAVGRAISKSLGLSTMQMFVLMKNVQFLNKLHILGAIIELSSLSVDDLKRFRSIIGLTQNLYGSRNIVAHEMFIPSDITDGVMSLLCALAEQSSFRKQIGVLTIFTPSLAQ